MMHISTKLKDLLTYNKNSHSAYYKSGTEIEALDKKSLIPTMILTVRGGPLPSWITNMADVQDKSSKEQNLNSGLKAKPGSSLQYTFLCLLSFSCSAFTS